VSLEPHEDGPAVRVDPQAAPWVRWGLLFYGLMAVVAIVWREGFYGESIFLAASSDGGAVGHLSAAGIGVLAGLVVVLLSHWMTRLTRWGEELARVLAETLGFLSVPNALLLALASGLAEEMFFRGALQPRVGLGVASVLFGAMHFVPRREFLPWTAFAVACGLLFGALFDWTGSLAAPVAAHVVVNGINLPLLARRTSDGSADPVEPNL